MRNYKEYSQKYIGASDIATLILVGGSGCEKPIENKFSNADMIKTLPLRFWSDGEYYAYVVDDDATIGEHYTLVDTFYNDLKIYDDNQLTFDIRAEEINVYRAGVFGCLIQYFNKRD